MKKVAIVMVVGVLALVGCKKSKSSHGAGPGPKTKVKSAPVAGSAAAPGAPRRSFLDDFRWDIGLVQKKLLRLAKAIPQNKYTWRAHPETKTLAELILHIASAHFNLSKFAGNPPPSDVKPRELPGSTTDKTKIVAILERAFAHVQKTIEKAQSAKEDLGATKKVFGKVRSRRFPFIIMMVHQHEHLGQLTAWARVVGVVPPWIKDRKEKMKRKKWKGRKPGAK